LQETASIESRLGMNLFFNKLYTTRKKKPPLKAIILLSELEVEDLPNIFKDREKLARVYNISVKKLEEGLYGLQLKKLVWRDIVKGYAIIDTSHKGTWVVLCNEESYFVNRALQRLFSALYPSVSRVYLNYSQITALLDAVKRAYHGRATLTFITVKREPKKMERSTGEKGTYQLWEENAEEDLLRLSKDFRVTLDRADFKVRDTETERLILRAHVSRRGVCKLAFGDFTAFYENVVEKAIDLGLNWKKFYSHRERIISDGKVILRPFSISYKFDFDKEQLQRLAERISKSYSCSVVHGGNPYFVANLNDYGDGSSFGVTVLGKVVTITPIIKATPQSAWKLTNRIQEILGDGDIHSIAE
jgi:hypothetical protein